MTRISILYPNLPNSKFDFQYYVQIHMPRSMELLSKHPGYKGVSVEKGIGTVMPGLKIPYIAMCHFLFDSLDDFIAAFTPNAAELQGDMVHYTDIEPVIQFNEVLIQQ
ncbi:MAG: EthD family reductase [Saprospiraceae bacterium]|nr:EthD family reductase [Saprospiraceae bacterium]